MTPAEGVRVALAELGYDPDLIRDPTDDDRARWPGVDVMIDSQVPDDVAHRACLLYRYHEGGPAALARCLARVGQEGWERPPCPGHPAGSLLAGATGCP